MISKKLTAILLAGVTGFTFWAGRIEAGSQTLQNSAPGTVLHDDDGGKVEIIPPQKTNDSRLLSHGGPVISSPWLHAVFVGAGWRQPAMSSLEPRVMQHFETFARSSEFASLSDFGVRAHDLPCTSREDLLDPINGKTIRDLEIQHRLNSIIQHDHQNPNHEVVYVVFIAADLSSALGNHTAGKDYLAYHNFFHAGDRTIHYVVVPFDSKVDDWLAHASDAVVRALINPEGNAWYREGTPESSERQSDSF